MEFRSSNIPEELKVRKQWLVWRLEKRGDTFTKVPYQVSGEFAKSNDPSTWTGFKECIWALKYGEYDGIGFAFAEGDGLFGVDLDHCFTPDGLLEPWAQNIVDRAKEENAYIEKSPSGDGIHIWGFGDPIKTGSKKKLRESDGERQGVEVYSWRSPRYLTVTGEQLED